MAICKVGTILAFHVGTEKENMKNVRIPSSERIFVGIYLPNTR